MRTIGIIPARMASTRFPGKPLAQIHGKSMLLHVWMAAGMGSAILDPVFVATADKEIIDWCEFIGIKYIVTRSDCRNGTERCHDAMRQLSNQPGDVVMNVQADEPMIRPESLDALARAFDDPAVDIASLCFAPKSARMMSDRNRVKVLVGEGSDALGFARSITAAPLWELYRIHVGVYAYRRAVLRRLAGMEPIGDLEQLAWMQAGYRIRMIEIPYKTIAVDAPGDIAKVEAAT